jgi:isopenicillin-N epimerase
MQTYPTTWQQFWSIDRSFTFLNHGSFGACPISVLEAQQRLRQQLESQPLRFFVREYEDLLDAARAKLAAFIGTRSPDLVFLPNATTGVSTVLRSLHFQPGDELLTTNHSYNACCNALHFVADRDRAELIVAQLPFPVQSETEIVEAVMARVSPRTKLVLLDHITSASALILPLPALIDRLNALGIETLIDGAHALGMLPLNLSELGATYYAGNCHKWLCAPKGAGFLYVHPDRQKAIRPLTISHGANSTRSDRSRFHLEFDWTGTDDPTAYLCIPHAIDWMGSIVEGGWDSLMARNRSMAIAARQLLCQTLKVEPPCPESMLGAMAALPLPDLIRTEVPADIYIDPLQNELFDHFKIEVPVTVLPANSPQSNPIRLLRICAQLYNTWENYEYLVEALNSVDIDFRF